MAEERLQKILARAGFGSRRSAEELITTGRVVVNGKVAELGSKADPMRDSISVDGRRLKVEGMVYIAVYKPPGVLSTTAGPDPRSKVTDLVPGGEHLHLVGRLDLESEGLILLTNDGELTQQLTHPRYEREKEYRVLVATHPDQKQLETWRRGVVLADGHRTQPADVRVERPYGKGTWLRVIMHEGHKREIRETGRVLGLPVAKLIRVRIASLRVGGMKAGDWRRLTPDEVNDLKSGAPAKKEFVPNTATKKRVWTKKPSFTKRPAGKPEWKAGAGKPSTDRPARRGKPSTDKPPRRDKPGAGGPARRGKPSAGRPPRGGRPGAGRPPRGGKGGPPSKSTRRSKPTDRKAGGRRAR